MAEAMRPPAGAIAPSLSALEKLRAAMDDSQAAVDRLSPEVKEQARKEAESSLVPEGYGQGAMGLKAFGDPGGMPAPAIPLKQDPFEPMEGAEPEDIALRATEVSGFADPSPASDAVAAKIYWDKGDKEAAAWTLGLSLGGLGAGAALVRLLKWRKAWKAERALDDVPMEQATKEANELSSAALRQMNEKYSDALKRYKAELDLPPTKMAELEITPRFGESPEQALARQKEMLRYPKMLKSTGNGNGKRIPGLPGTKPPKGEVVPLAPHIEKVRTEKAASEYAEALERHAQDAPHLPPPPTPERLVEIKKIMDLYGELPHGQLAEDLGRKATNPLPSIEEMEERVRKYKLSGLPPRSPPRTFESFADYEKRTPNLAGKPGHPEWDTRYRDWQKEVHAKRPEFRNITPESVPMASESEEYWRFVDDHGLYDLPPDTIEKMFSVSKGWTTPTKAQLAAHRKWFREQPEVAWIDEIDPPPAIPHDRPPQPFRRPGSGSPLRLDAKKQALKERTKSELDEELGSNVIESLTEDEIDELLSASTPEELDSFITRMGTGRIFPGQLEALTPARARAAAGLRRRAKEPYSEADLEELFEELPPGYESAKPNLTGDMVNFAQTFFKKNQKKFGISDQDISDIAELPEDVVEWLFKVWEPVEEASGEVIEKIGPLW